MRQNIQHKFETMICFKLLTSLAAAFSQSLPFDSHNKRSAEGIRGHSLLLSGWPKRIRDKKGKQ